ncbi:hypothetical protein RYX36_002064, partial [Vicia faba]
AEVRAVATNPSLNFIDRITIPKGVILYTDNDEWSSWKKLGDIVLHIELHGLISWSLLHYRQTLLARLLEGCVTIYSHV